MTGLKNFFEVFIAVGSWHSYFASPEPESSPSTHSFCNVSQSHLLKYTLTHKNHKISTMHLIHFRVSKTVSSIQCLKWIFLWKQNSIIQTSAFSVRIVVHVVQPRPFVFHCGINKCFRWVSYIFFWSEIHLHQLAHQHSPYADIQQHHILSFPVWSQCSRGSLKETKRNTFVTSHVLHVRASLYMSKLSDLGLRTKVVLRLVMSM